MVRTAHHRRAGRPPYQTFHDLRVGPRPMSNCHEKFISWCVKRTLHAWRRHPGRSKKPAIIPTGSRAQANFLPSYIIYCKEELRTKRNPPPGIISRQGETGSRRRHFRNGAARLDPNRPTTIGPGRSDGLSPPENGKSATGPPSPEFRRIVPDTLPDLNKTPLKTIFMVNEIVIQTEPEFLVLWWKNHC